MQYLFNDDICDWASWGRVFQSIEAFELLVQHIFTKGKICFDKSYMTGYFGEQNNEKIMELCLKGLLIHDFGSNIIRSNLGNINEIVNIKMLQDKLYQAIERGTQLES